MKTIYKLGYAALLLGLSLNVQAQTITTFAGDAVAGAGYSGDGGAANIAKLNHPKSMAIDDTGNVYIADAYNNVIRKVDPSGNISTYCGNVVGGYAGDGLDASAALFDHPNYVLLDAAHNMYICDPNNARIRKIDHTTNIITTIVGDGTNGYLGDGGPATAAEINFASGIALDAAGNLYIADANNNLIRKVDAATGIINTIAGTLGAGGYSGEGGPATAANIDFPFGIAVDGTGNIFISLQYDSRICKITAGGIITTYAGVGGGSGGGSGGDGGPATGASFDSPWGLAVDHVGNLYIADNGNNRVREVNTSGTVFRVAGGGGTGSAGDGGPATLAQMRDPVGVMVGPDGSIYIADYNNHEVRRVSGTLTHPPTFTAGHRQALPLCMSAPATAVNTMLAVADADAGQLETWSVVQAPLHGTLLGAYSTTSTGSTLTPTGLTYTPTTSYVGTDSFKVRISDGTASDTTTVVVTVSSCATNHAPAFVGGHSQSLPVCMSAAATDINSLMAISDIDAGQTETWSTVLAPAHGTLVSAFTITSIGSTLTTSGLSYTPTTGYTGTDSFKVRVNDGTASDTTTVHVTIAPCTGGVANTANGDNGIRIFPNPNPGTFSFSFLSAQQENVQIVITNMVGEKVKEITTTTNNPTEIKLNAPAGLYFLNAVTPQGKWSTKISITP